MCTPPPGRGAVSERRYRDAAPIISALSAFHRARGFYPDSLVTLVPEFLTADLAIARRSSEEPLGYARTLAGYTLSFRYFGPGSNHCEYRPDASGWTCGGLY